MNALGCGISENAGVEECAAVVHAHESDDECCCNGYEKSDRLHCDVAHHALVDNGFLLGSRGHLHDAGLSLFAAKCESRE